jgi:hypothetical protein
MIKIFCDKCEEQIRKESVVKIQHTFGYGSPRDGDMIEIELCEDCFQDIINEF